MGKSQQECCVAEGVNERELEALPIGICLSDAVTPAPIDQGGATLPITMFKPPVWQPLPCKSRMTTWLEIHMLRDSACFLRVTVVQTYR
jgi:hypothetical protein